MPVVLAPLGVIAETLFTLAAAAAATYLTIQLFKVLEGPLGRVPVLGGWLSSGARAVAQELSNIFGHLEAGIDKAIGWSWHLLAESANLLWHGIRNASKAILQASLLIEALSHAHALLRREIRDITKGLNDLPHNIGRRLRSLENGIEGANTHIGSILHTLSHTVMPRLRAAERELGRLDDVVIPNIRGIAQGAEADIAKLRKWIATNIPAAGTIAFAGAVAWALAQLGLGGLRCSSLTNSLGRRGCGLWSGLEDLLGLFVDALLLTNICTLLPLFETLVSDVADPLVVGLTDVGAGLCSGGIGPAPRLAVPTLSLPANPGVTLNLP